MTDKQLLKTVKGFTKGLLNKSSNVSMCFVVCSPLSAYLRLCGVENEMIEVYLHKGEDVHHHWVIQLQDKRIIDPTASQFNNKLIGSEMPDIYIGALPHYYKTSNPNI